MPRCRVRTARSIRELRVDFVRCTLTSQPAVDKTRPARRVLSRDRMHQLVAVNRDLLDDVCGGMPWAAMGRVLNEMGRDATDGGALGGVVGTVGGAAIGGIGGASAGGIGAVPGALAGAWAGAKAGVTIGTVIGGAYGLVRGVAHEIESSR
jgi:hypothetical protein